MATWLPPRAALPLTVLALFAAGCAGDDSDACGTIDQPRPLQITDVVPIPGSTVTNSDIAHGYTITGLDVFIDPAFAMDADHSAGLPSPAKLSSEVTAIDEGVLRYDFQPVTWTTAPGTVEVWDLAVHDSEGCYYAFPGPVFAYEVVP